MGAILNKVVREDSTKKVTFEQRSDVSEDKCPR